MDIKNVIIVVVDALRWDRVGAYNADSDITPNIDSVGESGTVFQNAFTTVNATDPAMTSLHTGRHPGGHGLINHGKNVTKKEKRAVASVGWLPEKLCNQGIETSWYGRRLGRWHFRGFDQHPNTESKVTDIENYLGSTLSGISPSLAKTASDIYNR